MIQSKGKPAKIFFQVPSIYSREMQEDSNSTCFSSSALKFRGKSQQFWNRGLKTFLISPSARQLTDVIINFLNCNIQHFLIFTILDLIYIKLLPKLSTKPKYQASQ